MQRFLDPAVLAGISSLDLVAKTVVDGFVAGLHRSPDFGFSQEFAEYRAYTPGDDLRHVDWNLFARTERCYLKRYRGETNSQLTVLLDASNSMEYTVRGPRPPTKKMDYARFIAASLFYLAIHNQRDAAGLIVFDERGARHCPALHAARPAWSPLRCPRTRRTPRAYRSCQAPASLPGTSPPARHRYRDLRLLRGSQEHRATLSSRSAIAVMRWCCSTCSIPRRFVPY